MLTSSLIRRDESWVGMVERADNQIRKEKKSLVEIPCFM